MLPKSILLFASILAFQLSAFAHASWQQHADDMYQVFGFERNEGLTNWMKFVSSTLIDNNNSDCAFSYDSIPFNFYSYLQEKYPNFQCKHRLLFHWGYNTRPWTTQLEDKVRSYGWPENLIRDFQNDLIVEQKRRNGFTNEYTENTFGLRHFGKDAQVARILISIAYDVHLLGDYEIDNTDLEGLQDLGSIVGDIINNLVALDKQRSSAICQSLRKESKNKDINIQVKASEILDILKNNFSNLLQKADNGNIAKHLYTRGIRFTNLNDIEYKIDQKETSSRSANSRGKRFHSNNKSGIGLIVFISLVVMTLLLILLLKKNK